MGTDIEEYFVFAAKLFGPFDKLALEQSTAPIVVEIDFGEHEYLVFAGVQMDYLIVGVVVCATVGGFG
jgi:hypothetical protein